jgi:hypothetical protein
MTSTTTLWLLFVLLASGAAGFVGLSDSEAPPDMA